MLTTGLFWQLFVDAIREGDGERVMLLLEVFVAYIFLKQEKKLYQEVVILLSQQQTMSPRQAAELPTSQLIFI